MIFRSLYDILTVIGAGIDSVLSAAPLTVKRGNNRGLLTATLSRVNSAADFDGSVTVGGMPGNYIAEAFGYDSRERVAESVSVDAQGVTVRENVTYSSSGLPISSVSQRFAPDGTVEKLAFAYTYDDFERQTSVTSSVNDVGMAKSITVYDGIGRTASVILRDLRGENSETVSYSYFTNGAVKSIATASGSMDMTLKYASGPVPSYSGNISAMEWKGADRVQRSYTYGYDGLNRLVSAQYAESGRPTYSHLLQQGSPDYSCSYSYDLNGNPLSVVRKGLTEVMGSGSSHLLARFGTVDNLTLKYSGNQVTKVSDSASNTSYTGASDFCDNNYREVEYEYDANGNMTMDFNRKIMGVVYNRLNQPVRVEIGNGSFVENLYDADGGLRQRRLRQKATGIPSIGGFFPADSIDSNGNYIRVTDYCGPWEYVNGKLNTIRIPGGYIEGDSVYFHISDHQGNIRQIWNATTAKTVQDNHYYPYGALLGESASTEYVKAVARGNRHPVSTNLYKYSEKEWQPTFGLNLYDFIARQYDPILCRFTSPDPLNGKYPQLSPYLYCAANPINITDPTGLKFIKRNMTEKEKAEFQQLANEEYLEGNIPELSFLYNLIANAPEVFIVDYVDEITDKNGDPISMQLQLSYENNEVARILQISSSSPPALFNTLEDMFHCYQQSNISKYGDVHNLEYEAKLFANLVLKGNGILATHDFPYFTDILTLLGLNELNFGYKPGFKEILNCLLFYQAYEHGVNLFIDYNTKNNTGNDEYKAISKSPPYSLLKFYELFNLKKP